METTVIIIASLLLTLLTKYLWVKFLGTSLREYIKDMSKDIWGIIIQLILTGSTFFVFFVIVSSIFK